MRLACLSTEVGRALDQLLVARRDEPASRPITGVKGGDVTPPIREFMFMLQWPDGVTYALGEELQQENMSPVELDFQNSPAEAKSITVDGQESRFIRFARCEKSKCDLWFHRSDPDVQDPTIWVSPSEDSESIAALCRLSQLLSGLIPSKKPKAVTTHRALALLREMGGVRGLLTGRYPKEDTRNPWRILLLVLLPLCLIGPALVLGFVGLWLVGIAVFVDMAVPPDWMEDLDTASRVMGFVGLPALVSVLLGTDALIETIRRRYRAMPVTVLFGIIVASPGVFLLAVAVDSVFTMILGIVSILIGLLMVWAAIAAPVRALRNNPIGRD